MARGFAMPGATSAPSLWIPVVDDEAVVRRLAARGIGVLPGSVFEQRRGARRHIHVNAGLPLEELQGELEQIVEVAEAVAEEALAQRRERYRAGRYDADAQFSDPGEWSGYMI